MTWIASTEANPFEAMNIPGLEVSERPYAPGQKWYQVRWPSGVVTDIFPDREDPTNIEEVDIHICGEMDLPYLSSRDDAYHLAFDIGESCGYYTQRIHANRVGVQGGYDSPFVITYEGGRIVNVEKMGEEYL